MRVVTGLVAIAMVLSGCGAKDVSVKAISPVEQVTAAPTTVTAAPPVYDTAYVDSVLRAHFAIRDEVMRNVTRTNQFTADDEAKLREIYAGDVLDFQISTFRRATDRTWGDEIKNRTNIVETKSIVKASDSCIWSQTQISNPAESTLFAFVMRPAPKTTLNQTGWIEYAYTTPDRVVTQGQFC